MKKLSVLVFFVVFYSVSFAQMSAALIESSAAFAQMSVTVLDNNINIPIGTASQFQNGNSVSKLANLLVSSNVAWDLSAKVTGSFTNGGNSIPTNSFGVDVTSPVGVQQPERMLTVSDQIVVSNAPSTYILLVDHPITLDVTYRAVGGTTFFNIPQGNYSSTLVYTITAH